MAQSEATSRSENDESVIKGTKLTVADIVLGTLLVLASVGVLLPVAFADGDKKSQEAVVQVQGDVVKRIPLKGSRRVDINFDDGSAVLATEPGRIRVTETDCPRKLCKKQGWVDNSYQSIVCVPHEMTVSIQEIEKTEQKSVNDVDVVTY